MDVSQVILLSLKMGTKNASREGNLLLHADLLAVPIPIRLLGVLLIQEQQRRVTHHSKTPPHVGTSLAKKALMRKNP